MKEDSKMSENVNEVVNNEDEFTPEYFAIVMKLYLFLMITIQLL